jgi:hypothetical protein
LSHAKHLLPCLADRTRLVGDGAEWIEIPWPVRPGYALSRGDSERWRAGMSGPSCLLRLRCRACFCGWEAPRTSYLWS